MLWPKKFTILIKRLLALMGLYLVLRILFLLWNWPLYADESLLNLVTSFARGFRYDLSALVTVNAPFVLLIVFLPQSWVFSGLYRFFEWPLFFFVNLIAIGTSVVDLEYYQFTGRRLSLDILSIRQDIEAQTTSMLFYYWYMAVIFLLFALALWKLSPSFRGRKWSFHAPIQPGFLRQSFWGLIFLALAVIAGRGGLQLKPLMPVDAYTQESIDLGSLTLNSAFTATRSSPGEPAKIPEYYSSTERLMAELPLRALATPGGKLQGYNVIVLVLESFGLEYMGLPNGREGYTPFLDSLAKEGAFFTRAFANGRRSIEALPSILCSLPALMDQPLITSNFQSNRYQCLGQVLSQAGYSTAFFHGAQNGSMSFDSFSKRAGFEHYYGLNEYTGPASDSDGKWGIYDEPFFRFAAQELTELSPPFAAVLFSLSSHHPYSIPRQFEGRFSKGSLEIHESIGYTDYALKQFFEAAKAKDWFNNTLFVITADHTSLSEDSTYKDLMGPYRVPLLFWASASELNIKSSDKVAQHIDIFPSITDLLGLSPKNEHLWGSALFNPEFAEGVSFNKTAKGYWIYNGQNFALVSPGGDTLEEGPNSNPQATSQTLAGQLKATIQYYFTGLINNEWPQTKTQVFEEPPKDEKDNAQSSEASSREQ